jgi:hypothetical protein
MILTDLEVVADAVVRRAQRQGYVVASDVREELARTNLPEEHWREVITLTGTALSYRRGRYYYQAAVSPRRREEQRQQRAILRAVRQVVRDYRQTATTEERRQQKRVDFVQPVQVLFEDHREITVMARDISASGIRLFGTRSLLGQKVRVLVHRGEPRPPACFVVRILWTCSIGDGLFENGGAFLEVHEQLPEILRLVRK